MLRSRPPSPCLLCTGRIGRQAHWARSSCPCLSAHENSCGTRRKPSGASCKAKSAKYLRAIKDRDRGGALALHINEPIFPLLECAGNVEHSTIPSQRVAERLASAYRCVTDGCLSTCEHRPTRATQCTQPPSPELLVSEHRRLASSGRPNRVRLGARNPSRRVHEQPPPPPSMPYSKPNPPTGRTNFTAPLS